MKLSQLLSRKAREEEPISDSPRQEVNGAVDASPFSDEENDFVNLYVEAQKRANEHSDAYRKREARATRIAFVACVGLVLAIVVSLVVVGTHKPLLHVIEVDSNAQIVRTYPAELHEFRADSQLYRAALKRWVEHWRRVTPDQALAHIHIGSVFDHVVKDSHAQKVLYEWYQQNNPFDRAKNATIGIEVTNIARITDDSWRIDWTEVHRSRSGHVSRTEKWTANVTTLLQKMDADQVLSNPLGLFVSELHFEEELAG